MSKRESNEAEWLFEKGSLNREDVVQARVVKEANLQLEGSAAGAANAGVQAVIKLWLGCRHPLTEWLKRLKGDAMTNVYYNHVLNDPV